MSEDNLLSVYPNSFCLIKAVSNLFSTFKSIRTDISFVHLVVVMIRCITFPELYYTIGFKKREQAPTLGVPLSDLPFKALKRGVSRPVLLP